MIERLHFHFSLSCIGEGNGNPLQCSCLENPKTGEPGGLPSMRSHRVGHDWSDLAAAAAAMCNGEGNGNPLQVLLPGKSHGRRSLVGCNPWVAKSQTQLNDFTFTHWRRKWQTTPVFLPGESQERGSLVGCRLWGPTESDTTDMT